MALHGGRAATKTPAWFTVEVALFAFTFVNFLNYVDRGIIAGAGTTIKGCVSSADECSHAIKASGCLGANVTRVDCISCRVCNTTCNGELILQTGFGISTQELGYLQSAFMIGYSISCVVIAKLVHVIRPFKIIGISLCLWTTAAVLSGLPNVLCDHSETGLCPYFWLMLVGRIMSGVGEAAIGTISVPYLDDRTPPDRKGIYFAIYYMTMPFGTAIGYIWAGFITKATGNHWQWAFFGEALPMIPFAILAFWIPDWLKSSGESSGAVRAGSVNAAESSGRSNDPQAPLLDGKASSSSPAYGRPRAAPTIWTQVVGCLSSPVFVCVCLGYASYSGVVAGLGFYAPLYLQTAKPCDRRWDFSQSMADTYFGALTAVAGFLGTAIGGYMLDRQRRNSTVDESVERMVAPAWNCFWQAAVGLAFLLGGIQAVFALDLSPVLFFVVLGLAELFLFMCIANISVIIVWSVPSEFRSMGLAISILILHGLGDVPSPIVIGYLADHTTPNTTLTATLAWFGWTVLFWFLTYLLAQRATRQMKAATANSHHHE